MKINTVKPAQLKKVAFVFLSIFFSPITGTTMNAQVLLDSHSSANGASTWNITTIYSNELIIISAGGYGTGGNSLNTSPGTITVNGNNATYINEGRWLSNNFSWNATIWAYVAATPGTYTCVCTESGLITPFYLNFAASVYQANCPLGLGLGNIVTGGVDSNHGPTTITATITTTENNSWIYGTVDNNDNGATGTVAWNSQLTELDHTYINDGVDGAQADSTYALAGTYTITSTDIGANNVWMTIALIAVQPNVSCCPLTATASVLSNVKCNGGTGGSAAATPNNGHTPYTYSWSPGGQVNDTATDLSAGSYTVTISDTVGCSATAKVTITQPALLKPTLTAKNILCYGGMGSINSSISGGASPYTYLWAPGGTTTANASNLAVGCYTLNVTDAHGCTASDSACITQPAAALDVTVSGPAVLCVGDSGTLNATVTGGTSSYGYRWSPGIPSTTSRVRIPGAAQTYTVIVTDANNCTASAQISVSAVSQPVPVITPKSDSICQGDSITLSASGGNTYRWSNGKTTTTITVGPNVNTTYTLTASNGVCSDSTTVKVKITPKVTATSSITDSVVCPHDTSYLTITASGGPATYKWSNGATTSSITVSDTVTTTYTATAYGVCDSVQKIIKVTVVPLPKLTMSGTRWKCKGTKDTITISSSANPTTYIWDNGKTTSSIITGSINSDSVISVTAYNSLGCSVKDTFKITERAFPTGSVTYSPGCGNSETPITATANGTGPFTYKWSTGGTYDTINVLITDTTTYTVVISNGCPITKKVTVIQDVPFLSACCSTTIFAGTDTIITASGKNITSYLWEPNNGLNCDTCGTVIANPTVTTTYTVIGTDAAGCTSERTVTITVETPCFDFKVPNVFTPDNPGALGLDNILYIKTQNITGWSMYIYDRWGKEVYKSTNPEQYWDGTTEGGSKALAGVYYYIITGNCENNTYKKQGFVQLIR